MNDYKCLFLFKLFFRIVCRFRFESYIKMLIQAKYLCNRCLMKYWNLNFLNRFILPENMDLRDEIARGQNRADFLQTTLKIKERYASIQDGEIVWNHINSGNY